MNLQHPGPIIIYHRYFCGRRYVLAYFFLEKDLCTQMTLDSKSTWVPDTLVSNGSPGVMVPFHIYILQNCLVDSAFCNLRMSGVFCCDVLQVLSRFLAALEVTCSAAY